MKKAFILFISLLMLLPACAVSEKSFSFESGVVNEKKLIVSFTASPLEQDSDAYTTEVKSTNVSITDKDGNVIAGDVIRSPVNGQGAFSYDSEYDIPVSLSLCETEEKEIYVGLVGIPTGDDDYYVTVYIYKDEILTSLGSPFPHVKSIEDITVDGDVISFYDLSAGSDASYCVDFETFTSKEIP